MNIDKFLSGTTFLYGVGGVFSGALVYQSIMGRPLDVVAVGILTSIVGFVIHSNGNQQGVTSTNDTVAKTAIAQFPLTPAGIEAEATRTGALSHVSTATEPTPPLSA